MITRRKILQAIPAAAAMMAVPAALAEERSITYVTLDNFSLEDFANGTLVWDYEENRVRIAVLKRNIHE